jgi:formylglycine-generating enzyme required for sulfatase activity
MGQMMDVGVPVPPVAQAVPAPQSAQPTVPVEWFAIPAGRFRMGTDTGDGDEKPVHTVAIAAFHLSKTLVTVEQYAECVAQGRCTLPGSGGACNWGVPDRQRHPINCVDWDQASQFARFEGARLPTESEWEYAARSGGKNQNYPWGDEAPTCDKAVMYGDPAAGCAKPSTLPVCSKPAGIDRVLRGGSWGSDGSYLRATFRNGRPPNSRLAFAGFRLAKSLP